MISKATIVVGCRNGALLLFDTAGKCITSMSFDCAITTMFGWSSNDVDMNDANLKKELDTLTMQWMTTDGVIIGLEDGTVSHVMLPSSSASNSALTLAWSCKYSKSAVSAITVTHLSTGINDSLSCIVYGTVTGDVNVLSFDQARLHRHPAPLVVYTIPLGLHVSGYVTVRYLFMM